MTEPEKAPDDIGATPEAEGTPKRALARVDRLLTDEELGQSGARKLIIDRLDEAERTIKDLEKYREDYHATHAQLLVAQSSLVRVKSLDTIQSAQIGLGCLALGYIPAVWGNNTQVGMLVVAGVVLIGASLYSKRKSG